ncbi:hypothetical protein OROMI_017016 [Orobanche minor]
MILSSSLNTALLSSVPLVLADVVLLSGILSVTGGLFQPHLREKMLRNPNFRMLPCSDRGCSGCYEWRKQESYAVWKWTLVAESDTQVLLRQAHVKPPKSDVQNY